MSGPSSPSPDLEAAPREAEPPAPRRRGAVVGAVLAVAASAGLAWYLTRPDPPPAPAMRPQVAEIAPRAQLAPATADASQVERAYDQVQTVYADQGAAGLARFSEGCAETLEKDARVLDFCLAFDLFAQAVAPPEGQDGAWFAAGEARRLRLTRAALPAGVDPQARIQAVEALMRRASGADQTVAESAPAPARKAAVQRTAAPDARAQARQKLRAALVRTPPARRRVPVDRCASLATIADRMVCGDARLQAADARMRQAYVGALAAGADPEILDREQADWRRARAATTGRDDLAYLYNRRIEDLEVAADAPIPPPR